MSNRHLNKQEIIYNKLMENLSAEAERVQKALIDGVNSVIETIKLKPYVTTVDGIVIRSHAVPLENKFFNPVIISVDKPNYWDGLSEKVKTESMANAMRRAAIDTSFTAHSEFLKGFMDLQQKLMDDEKLKEAKEAVEQFLKNNGVLNANNPSINLEEAQKQAFAAASQQEAA